jgi:hypothetical protein
MDGFSAVREIKALEAKKLLSLKNTKIFGASAITLEQFKESKDC